MGSSHTMAVVGAPRFIDIVVVVVAVVEESSREVVLKKKGFFTKIPHLDKNLAYLPQINE